MKTILLILAITLVTPLAAEPAVSGRDSDAFRAYQARLRGRRTNALYIRRANYLARPPARGWLAIHRPYNAMNPMGLGMTAPRWNRGAVRLGSGGSPHCSASRLSMSMDY